MPKLALHMRGYCACAADARVLRMRGRCRSNVWTAVVITMSILDIFRSDFQRGEDDKFEKNHVLKLVENVRKVFYKK